MTTIDPMDAIKQTFFQECDELLLAMEEGLIAIESGEADNEAINAVFRAVHSVKGGAGAFGFVDLVAFAHIFETVLDHLRSGKLAATDEVSKVLLRAGDILSDHVGAARTGESLPKDADSESMAELAVLSGETEEPADGDEIELPVFKPMFIAISDEPAPAATANQGWNILFVPHAALLAKANEPFLLIRELAALGQIKTSIDLSRLPTLDSLETDQAYFGWKINLSGDIARAAIEETFEFVEGDCDLTIEPFGEPDPTAANGDVPIAPPSVTLTALPETASTPVSEKKDMPAVSSEAPAKQTIRVDLDKLDRLVNLVGELVITQAMLSQQVNECDIPRSSSVGNGLTELEHLMRDLQESVMAIRTQPVKSVFQRMPRLVRELAAQTNKKVRLVIEGESTEVDKTVIERLGEPLTHMIRNAIDHGVESPEDRLAVGKPEEGTVTLSAEHRGGRIIIEVSDDGRGIDRPRVRQIAVDRGILPASASLSDEETDNLIFMPGFSTANQVSSISGRGVGMDVVRRNIVDLGGRIVIGSIPKQGSRFSLTLPLTLAVLDGMVVTVGDQTFVLPLAHIVESLKPLQKDIHPFGVGRSLLNVRNTYVPLVKTGELLDVKGALQPPNGVVILVESQGTGRLALAVDAIIGQRQVVIKGFEDNYQHIEGIAAATILGDGRVALILDVDGLVSLCRDQLNNAALREFKPTGT